VRTRFEQKADGIRALESNHLPCSRSHNGLGTLPGRGRPLLGARRVLLMRPAAQTLTDDSGLETEDDPEFCEMLRQDPDRATFAGQRKNRLEDPAMIWTLEKDEQLAAGYLLENHFGQKRFGCIRKNSSVTCGLARAVAFAPSSGAAAAASRSAQCARRI